MQAKWLREIHDAAAVACRLEELGGEALGLLRRAIDAECDLLFTFDRHGQVQGITGELATAMPSYARTVFPHDPLQETLRGIEPTMPTIVSWNMVDFERFTHSAAYWHFYQPRQLEQLIGLWLTTEQAYGTGGMIGLLLTRPSRNEPFRTREIERLRAVHPFLHAAWRRQQRLSQLEQQQRQLMELLAESAPKNLLLVDTHLAIRFMTPAAEHLLQDCSGSFAGQLPASLEKRLDMLFARWMSSRRRIREEMAIDEARQLRAVIELVSGPTGERMARIELLDGSAVGRALGLAQTKFGLTRSELRVLEHMAEGQSNRQIAQALFVSLDTVKTHVRHVLRKLQVASRTQAVLAFKRSLQSDGISISAEPGPQLRQR